MTDEGDGDTSANAGSGAPIDFDRLETIRDRLATDDRFVQIKERPEFAPERLVCTYDLRYYPSRVERAYIKIAWYENGDFTIHYHEVHEDEAFDHRWDRHPSTHNTRDHIHPGPDAPTPGDDTDHPDEWRDILSIALTEIETRQRAFWAT